jgi:hypothetical protein
MATALIQDLQSQVAVLEADTASLRSRVLDLEERMDRLEVSQKRGQ